jgi:Mrp family chromosome partitioning ATPase
MEKLQLALEKARRKREEQPEPAPAPAAPAAAPARKTVFRETAAQWQSLTPFEPDRSNLLRNRIVSLDACEEAAAFDLLRTKTLLQMRKNGWKRLAITSPTMGCGKTTTALNMAFGLTRQADKSAIVFEMDMRRPSIARLLGQKPEYGVSDLLNGTVDFRSQAVRVGDNVALSYNFGPEKNTSQLLMRDSTARQIDAIEQEFQPDIVIFDLPPMLASDDTTAFLKNTDCALLIAGAEKTTTSQVDSCEREIAEHTNVLGVVLNKCRFVEDESSYAYNHY